MWIQRCQGDKLKDLVSATNEDIILTTPQEEKRSAITIVGLSKEYKKEEIFATYPEWLHK